PPAELARAGTPCTLPPALTQPFHDCAPLAMSLTHKAPLESTAAMKVSPERSFPIAGSLAKTPPAFAVEIDPAESSRTDPNTSRNAALGGGALGTRAWAEFGFSSKEESSTASKFDPTSLLMSFS